MTVGCGCISSECKLEDYGLIPEFLRQEDSLQRRRRHKGMPISYENWEQLEQTYYHKAEYLATLGLPDNATVLDVNPQYGYTLLALQKVMPNLFYNTTSSGRTKISDRLQKTAEHLGVDINAIDSTNTREDLGPYEYIHMSCTQTNLGAQFIIKLDLMMNSLVDGGVFHLDNLRHKEIYDAIMYYIQYRNDYISSWTIVNTVRKECVIKVTSDLYDRLHVNHYTVPGQDGQNNQLS